MTLRDSRILLNPQPQPLTNPYPNGYETFPEAIERLTVSPALLSDPDWVAQPFVQRLLEDRARGQLPDDTVVDVYHFPGCGRLRHPPDPHGPCTCNYFIIVLAEDGSPA